MPEKRIAPLRKKINKLNLKILSLLNQRAAVVQEIGELKRTLGFAFFDPARESEMLEYVLAKNKGPFSHETVANLFREIFRASLNLIGEDTKVKLKVSRKHKPKDTVVRTGNVKIGEGRRVQLVAGPCSVESYRQLDCIAAFLKSKGVSLLRGGAYKPRTSPYAFQGLREDGLKILRDAAQKYGMVSVTEVMDTRDVEKVSAYADVLQIGTRNMFNYDLLRAVGQARKPVVLKRAFMATMEEFLLAAEYIMLEGNTDIILCERGIRTFERWTRNTLDISAVPVLKQESHLPMIVDLSHATGRRDIVVPLARASVAAGAHGIMVEVHHTPEVALSDSEQQLNFKQFSEVLRALKL